MVTKDDVFKALMNVVDPDIGVDVVSLGLIYDVKVSEDEVFVLFTLTFPGCPYADFLVNEVKETVSELSGVKSVEVRLTFDPPWNPDKIDPDIRAALNI
ncbi:metal-sulfur cluster assembly factor [Candidatus Woesearchaeota archaeon]|nr:metal-sulfur cluster assembly factor [Candidatus Woesearchaeota archaeon]